MAKKDTSKKQKDGKKDKANAGAVEAVEAVRHAVERTFAATAKEAQSLRAPAQEFAGDLAHAANRFREVLESRVLEELKGLRNDVEGLAKRVSALEGPRAASSSSTATASRATARKPAARKPAARKTAASRSTATKRAAASKPASSTSRSTASKRSAAAKPASSTRRSSTAKRTTSSSRGRTTRGGGSGGSGGTS